jgi:hypothetical protein
LLLAWLVVCPSSEVVALVVGEVTEPNLYALVLGLAVTGTSASSGAAGGLGFPLGGVDADGAVGLTEPAEQVEGWER